MIARVSFFQFLFLLPLHIFATTSTDVRICSAPPCPGPLSWLAASVNRSLALAEPDGSWWQQQLLRLPNEARLRLETTEGAEGERRWQGRHRPLLEALQRPYVWKGTDTSVKTTPVELARVQMFLHLLAFLPAKVRQANPTLVRGEGDMRLKKE